VGANMNETVGKNKTVDISKDLKETIGGKHEEAVTKEYVLQAKKIQLVADDEINIKTGDAEIVMKSSGDITINGAKINIKGSGDIILKGSSIKEN
jgi:type VI secretion system secreted protein VgrG